METSDELVEALGMSVEEQDLADKFYAAIQAMSNVTERSQQSAEFRVGVSDLGFCSERTRRMLLGRTPEEEPDVTLAWIGTALGDHAEQAIKAMFPQMICQSSVRLNLPGETRNYTLTGHPDVIDPGQGILADIKTTFGTGVVRRTGPSMQQQFQRHGYAKAAWEAGYFPYHDLADLRVANVWIDRSGVDRHPYVQMEPYSEEYVTQAGQWLDEVVYRYIETVRTDEDHEAAKEPPREMCAVVCGFYSTCRALDSNVSGLLTDPGVLASIAMYKEGLELGRKAAKLKKEASANLRGIEGSTGSDIVRWVHVNETVTKPGIRAAHDKIDVKPIKRVRT